MSAQQDIASQVLSAAPTPQTPKEVPMSNVNVPVTQNASVPATQTMSEELQLYLASLGENDKLDFGKDSVVTSRPSCPILKAVQRTTQDSEALGWGLGSIYITVGEGDKKQNIFIAKNSEGVIFNPLFIYTSFDGYKPYRKEDTNQYPFYERSTDPDSDASKRAGSYNPSLRNVKTEKGIIKYKESLNVFALLKSAWCENWDSTVVQFSFVSSSAPGGKAFQTLHSLRPLPYYLNVFRLYSKKTDWADGDAQSLFVDNPSGEEPITVQVKVSARVEWFKKFQNDYKEKLFDVSRDAAEKEEGNPMSIVDAQVAKAVY